MTKSGAALWLRRGELAFFLIGVSLLGGALAATVNSRIYQARQGRAFSDLEQKAAAMPQDPESWWTPAAGADPLVLGRIEIPRIGVTAIVREGDDDATLAVAVGHVPGTARPGERGNMVLAGHRDSFFRALRDIQRHDSISIRTAGRRDEYLVDSTEVVGQDETRVLEPTGDAVLTLVTCYPFEFVGHAPDRFIVRASRVLRHPPKERNSRRHQPLTQQLKKEDLCPPHAGSAASPCWRGSRHLSPRRRSARRHRLSSEPSPISCSRRPPTSTARSAPSSRRR